MADTSHLSPAVRELAEAIRLTREYVGEEMLPRVEGWSWYDALRRWAPEYLPQAEAAVATETPAVANEYPRPDGEFTVLGPETFTNAKRAAICHKGEMYYAKVDTSGEVMATAPPCPMRAQNHPHDAHDWNDGEGRCPGYGEPAEGHAEPAPPQTAEERAHDLEYVIQRVREAVGTDQPVTPAEERITALETTLREVLAQFVHDTHPGRPCKQTGHVNVETVRRWHAVLSGEAQ